MNSLNLVKLDHARSLIGRGKSQFYSDISKGYLPPPIKVGHRSVCWVQGEIEKVVAARVAGLTDMQIKGLVSEIVKNRQSVLERE